MIFNLVYEERNYSQKVEEFKGLVVDIISDIVDHGSKYYKVVKD